MPQLNNTLTSPMMPMWLLLQLQPLLLIKQSSPNNSNLNNKSPSHSITMEVPIQSQIQVPIQPKHRIVKQLIDTELNIVATSDDT